MEPATTRTRAWAWYLAAVVFATQYYVVSAVGSTPNDTLATVIGASAVAAGLIGLIVHRPRRLWAWLLVVAAIGSYLAGDAVLASLEADNPFPPFPSLADWLYLAVYPALVVAFVAIRRGLAPGRDRRATIDAVIVGVAALGVFAPLYLAEWWNSPFFDATQQRVITAYPIGDAVLLGVGARLVFAAGRRVDALTLLGGAAMAGAIGNAVYNAQELGGGFETGGVGSVGWLAFTTLLGGAVLHPSVRFSGTSAATARSTWPSGARTLGALSVAGAHLAWGDADSRVLSAICLVAIVALGGLREAVGRSPERAVANVDRSADHVEREPVAV